MKKQHFQHHGKHRKGERGSALVYILIAIALLAALTVSFMEPSSQQTSAQSTFRTVTAIKSQIDSVRSAIQECILRYPNGDQTIDVSASGTDPGAMREYPLKPDSAHLPTASQSGDRLVRNIRCPGDNPGNPNENDHQRIFSGSSGRFLPPPPDLFGDWQYYNGADGVFFWIETDKSDAFLRSALEKLDETYGECEGDIVDATGGTAVALDTETPAQVSCTGGSLCYRMWVVAREPNAYISGTPEATAGCPG